MDAGAWSVNSAVVQLCHESRHDNRVTRNLRHLRHISNEGNCCCCNKTPCYWHISNNFPGYWCSPRVFFFLRHINAKSTTCAFANNANYLFTQIHRMLFPIVTPVVYYMYGGISIIVLLSPIAFYLYYHIVQCHTAHDALCISSCCRCRRKRVIFNFDCWCEFGPCEKKY